MGESKQWLHRLSVARAQRAKDNAEVADLHMQGLTFQEIGVRLGRSASWAFNRYRDALAWYRERASEAVERRNAIARARHEHLYREAMAGWRRSVEGQERRRAKTRKGGKGEQIEEQEIETCKGPGDPRFLEAATKQLLAMERLDGLKPGEETDGAPKDFLQLVLSAQRAIPPVIDEDGEQSPAGEAQPKAPLQGDRGDSAGRNASGSVVRVLPLATGSSSRPARSCTPGFHLPATTARIRVDKQTGRPGGCSLPVIPAKQGHAGTHTRAAFFVGPPGCDEGGPVLGRSHSDCRGRPVRSAELGGKTPTNPRKMR